MLRKTRLWGLLIGLWRHLGRRRQRQLILVAFLMFVSAGAEVVSLGAVLPFIGILASPQLVFDRPYVASAAKYFGWQSPAELVLPITLVFVAAALVAAVLRILVLWVTTRFTFASGADLSMAIYRRTLYQPYRVQVSRSSSQIISGITAKVGSTVLGVLLPSLQFLSSIILLVALLGALVVIDPMVAVSTGVGFGGCYVIITWFTRRRLRRNSQRITKEYTQVVKALQEGLGGIRDVLLDGTQPVYCRIYGSADVPLRRAIGDNVFIGTSPRFAMEALGMVLIAALAYALSSQKGGLGAALPLLAVLAVGAQRMLPCLQQAFQAWASIVGNEAVLADTMDLLDQPAPSENGLAAVQPLELRESIAFQDVRFRYSDERPWALDGLTLRVSKGARVGLVGTTGSGKSTALDLLMGLLEPTAGRILVDGRPIEPSMMRSWQRTLAHVPQSIFLADTTIAENIAFGVQRENIDMERVRSAAQQAQIADFIETKPEQYEAIVGERGIRLSGGQRQRIGIARALYKQATVLILDEATSALDNLTEQSVIEAIYGLNRSLTVFIIAHRLTTVRACDVIFELEQGRVVAQGTFAELLARSPSFRHLAAATSAH